MSFELERKVEYPTGYGCYDWRYTPVEDDTDGWKKIFKVLRALDESTDGVRIFNVPGPYEGEKEYSDIGWKDIKTIDKLEESLEDLLRDENSEVHVHAPVDGKSADVYMQNFGDYGLRFSVRGRGDKKLVSTIIKKALGE